MTTARLALLSCLLVAASCGSSVDLIDERAEPTTSSDDSVAAETAAPNDPQPADAEPTEAPTPGPTATPEPTPTPLPPGQISVNDTDAVGTAGDDLLSLVEAVELANGRLDPASLSAAEAALVQGAPGAVNTDTITVDLPPDSTILFPGGDRWIIEMFGNDGDTVVGNGVVLTGAVQESGVSHNIMLIGSSEIRISGFVFDRVTNAMAVESAGNVLAGLTIEGNTFRNVAIRDVAVRNSVTGGSITNATISGNSFDAPERLSDLRAFISVEAGVGRAGEITADTSVTSLTIADNSMSAPGGTVGRCITIAAGHVPFGSPSTVNRASITGLDITGNTMSGCTRVIEVVAALVDQTDATITDSTISGVGIIGNTVDGGGETGVQIHGGHVDSAPSSFNYTAATAATVTGNRVDDVVLSANTLSGLNVGIALLGGEFAVDGSGEVSANVVGVISLGDANTFDQLNAPCIDSADEGTLAAGNILEAACSDITG